MAIDFTKLELQEMLGRGSEGIVYRAKLGAGQVAVKILSPATHAAAQQVMERLTAFSRGSSDGAIAAVLAFGTMKEAPEHFRAQLPGVAGSAIYSVMDYLPNGTLADFSGPLSEKQAVAAVWLTAEALSRLPLGVFHGDVRETNIVPRAGGVTLLDPDLSRVPSAEDDVRALGELARQLAGNVQSLKQLWGDLVGSPPLPKLSEVRARLRAMVESVGATAEDLGVVNRPIRGRTPLHNSGTARVRRRWVRGVGVGIGALLLVGFGPFFVMNSPLRPAPTGYLVTTSDIVSTQDGLYDTTGTVQHHGLLYTLKCGEKVDGRRGFVQITIAEPVKRVAILLDPGDGQVAKENQHVLWELTDPPLHQVYCFDVPDQKYIIEQDRLLADGQPQIDPKSFQINLHHPLRLKTTEHMMYAPAPGANKSLWRWWWDGFE